MCTSKSLKLLAWKVNTKWAMAQVHAIRNIHGEKRALTADILRVFSDYYTDLYSTSHPGVAEIKDF